jgi:hypothetical protein
VRAIALTPKKDAMVTEIFLCGAIFSIDSFKFLCVRLLAK